MTIGLVSIHRFSFSGSLVYKCGIRCYLASKDQGFDTMKSSQNELPFVNQDEVVENFLRVYNSIHSMDLVLKAFPDRDRPKNVPTPRDIDAIAINRKDGMLFAIEHTTIQLYDKQIEFDCKFRQAYLPVEYYFRIKDYPWQTHIIFQDEAPPRGQDWTALGKEIIDLIEQNVVHMAMTCVNLSTKGAAFCLLKKPGRGVFIGRAAIAESERIQMLKSNIVKRLLDKRQQLSKYEGSKYHRLIVFDLLDILMVNTRICQQAFDSAWQTVGEDVHSSVDSVWLSTQFLGEQLKVYPLLTSPWAGFVLFFLSTRFISLDLV